MIFLCKALLHLGGIVSAGRNRLRQTDGGISVPHWRLQAGSLRRQSSGHVHYSTDQIEALLKELRTVAALEVGLNLRA